MVVEQKTLNHNRLHFGGEGNNIGAFGTKQQKMPGL